MAERVYLTVGEVLEIHLQQIDDYGGAHGLRDKGLLESPVFRPQIGYYNTIAEEAAALMESLANGCDLEVKPLAAYEFMMQSIARGEFRFGPILEWINNHIRQE